MSYDKNDLKKAWLEFTRENGIDSVTFYGTFRGGWEAGWKARRRDYWHALRGIAQEAAPVDPNAKGICGKCAHKYFDSTLIGYQCRQQGCGGWIMSATAWNAMHGKIKPTYTDEQIREIHRALRDLLFASDQRGEYSKALDLFDQRIGRLP